MPAARIIHPESVTSGKGEYRILMPVTLATRGVRTELRAAAGPASRPRRDRALIGAVRRAHNELMQHGIDLLERAPGLDAARGVADPYIRKLVRLAFLAPDIQRSILEGRQPAGLALGKLMKSALPLDWDAQRRMLGFV